MSAIDLDYRRLLRLVLSILAALLVLAASQRAVQAAQTFIVPGSSGYGVSDCLNKPQGCSEVVASAWCEAHGYAAALAYGRADDATGAIPKGAAAVKGIVREPIASADPAKIDPDASIVTCGD